jgi:hypothetical protein
MITKLSGAYRTNYLLHKKGLRDLGGLPGWLPFFRLL